MKRSLLFLCTLLISLCFSSPGSYAAEEATITPQQDSNGSIQGQNNGSQDSFVYSPQGRRDPFEPLLPEEPVIAEVVKKTRPEKIKGPLEKFELKQFRLMAIMVVNGRPHAMVKTPDGKSYTVKVNDYIGMNGGVVTNIQTKVIDIDANGMRVEKSPDRIVVEESGIDSVTGQVVKENRYIAM